MHDELKEMLAQGDCDLYRTAGERAEYSPRGGGRAHRCTVVAGAAPVEWVMEGPGGAAITCNRMVLVARHALPQVQPAPGDRVQLGSGECLQVVRVTGSEHDPSWHLDCALITP